MNIYTRPGTHYTGDPFDGIIVARIDNTLLIACDHDMTIGPDWNGHTKTLENTIWRLPSITELGLMYEKRYILGMNGKIYWSESYNPDLAWYQDMASTINPAVNISYTWKNNKGYRARPVRRITIPAYNDYSSPSVTQTTTDTGLTTSIEPGLFAAYRQGFHDGYATGLSS